MADNQDNPQGRRIAKRSSLKVFLWFSVIERLEDSEKSSSQVDGGWRAPKDPIDGLAHSVDISAAGLGFVASRPLEAGLRIFVEFTSNLGNFSAVACVQNCRPQGSHFRIGTRLEIIPPNDRSTLAAIVA